MRLYTVCHKKINKTAPTCLIRVLLLLVPNLEIEHLPYLHIQCFVPKRRGKNRRYPFFLCSLGCPYVERVQIKKNTMQSTISVYERSKYYRRLTDLPKLPNVRENSRILVLLAVTSLPLSRLWKEISRNLWWEIIVKILLIWHVTIYHITCARPMFIPSPLLSPRRHHYTNYSYS